MQKENDSVENESGTEKEKEGLTLREALEVAVESAEATNDVVRAHADTAARDVGAVSNPTEPALEAPAEYTNEEKEDFKSLSRKGQEAQLRLHRSRLQTLDQIRAEKGTLAEERKQVHEERQLAERVRPFIKAMGGKFPPDVALQKAVQMWEEFENASDPYKAAAAYLEAKGAEVPPEWKSGRETPKQDPELKRLREAVDTLTMERSQEHQARYAHQMRSEWDVFESQKNAAGVARFPDANNTESGMRLAAQIGTLVQGKTDLSRQFIALAKERIPGLTYTRLIEEAYRYVGGRVDDSEAPKSQSKTSHLARSQRAAASVPGGGGQTARNGTVKKMTRREALAAAIEDYRGA